MASFTEMFRSASSKVSLLLVILATGLLYSYYVNNLSTNPPGFYLDESAGSYNAYLIATTGASEFGDLPIYPKYYTGSNSEQGNPTHLYMLAAMYLFVAPSVVSARVLAASTIFLACFLIGVLARRLSGRTSVGVIVGVTALFTPWLFDASRLVLEVFTYPLSVVVFLLALHSAQKRDRWFLRDVVFIAIGLALVMYSYSIGRLLAPAFAFGLILFAHNRERIFSIVKTWLAFAVTLLPYVYFTLTKPGAASKRFLQITYLSWEKPILDNLSEFLSAYFSDISPTFLLYNGDPLLRHHVPGFGELLAPTVVLAIVGLGLVAFRLYRSAWWIFIAYGLFVSVLPGALTTQRFHALRLSAVPVFVLILSVPAISYLLGDRKRTEGGPELEPKALPLLPQIAGIVVLTIVLVLSAYQAYSYQQAFAIAGPTRGYAFDAAYLPAFNRALQERSRPIYLEDGYWGPAYVHAFWYATVQGVPLSNFVHLLDNERPPAGALVLSSHEQCTGCEIVNKSGPYLLYRVSGPFGSRETAPPIAVGAFAGGEGGGKGQFNDPRSIAVTPDGIIFVSDTGNNRIGKFDPNGNPLETFARPGNARGEFKQPNGIAIDQAGNIFVADPVNHKVVKLDKAGSVVKEWQGPEPGFYGPRDIAFGPDGMLYVLDQGRARVVRFDPASANDYESFGTPGSGDGQFAGSTGIGIGGGFVFIADAGNNRIQVFDRDMNFVRQWDVPEWEKYIWHYPDVVYDDKKNLLYVTNGWKSEILAFDPDGTPRPDAKPLPPQPLNNPSGIALAQINGQRSLFVLNIGNPRVTKIDLP
jgi:DNA-binding beta-propeller fold protein YncE/4-amino-4-deoxy-L-arabinose transferase-like glycosyltransferase